MSTISAGNTTTTTITVTGDTTGNLIFTTGGANTTALTLTNAQVANFANTPQVNGTALQTAKAWVNFNGIDTVAIRGSFNVSSITDNGTGDFTVNFTTALPNIDYSYNVSCSPNYGVNIGSFICINASAAVAEVAPTTSACRFALYSQNIGNLDPKYVNVTVFG
jgi:hypothetical protein